MFLEWLIPPKSIKETHRGALIDRVKIKCLEAVKIYGNSPIKLFTKINKKSPINSMVLPLKAPGPKRFLNS
jgi:hypothetical protein